MNVYKCMHGLTISIYTYISSMYYIKTHTHTYIYIYMYHIETEREREIDNVVGVFGVGSSGAMLYM